MIEQSPLLKPTVTYTQFPDNKWVVEIVYDEKHKFIHSGERKYLEKLVKGRYGPMRFWR